MKVNAADRGDEVYTAIVNGNPLPDAFEADTKAGYVSYYKRDSAGRLVIDGGRIATDTRWGIVAIRRESDGRLFTERD